MAENPSGSKSMVLTSILSHFGHIFPDLNPSYHLSYFSLFTFVLRVRINKAFMKWNGTEKSKLRSDSLTAFNEVWGHYLLVNMVV